MVLAASGDYNQAKTILEQANRADPGNSYTLFNLAKVLAQTGESEEAVTLFRRGYRDLFGLSGALIAATDEARRLLILYLDEKRRRQDLVIADQHLRISRQVMMLVGFLAGLTIVSMKEDWKTVFGEN